MRSHISILRHKLCWALQSEVLWFRRLSPECHLLNTCWTSGSQQSHELIILWKDSSPYGNFLMALSVFRSLNSWPKKKNWVGAVEEKEGTKKITFSQNVKKHCHLIINQYKSSLKWECRVKEKYITWFTKICWTHTFREHIYRQSKTPFDCESVYLSVFLCAWASTKKQSGLHVVNPWFLEWAASYYILCGSPKDMNSIVNTTIIVMCFCGTETIFGSQVCDEPGYSDEELKGVMNIRLYQYLISNQNTKNN